MTSLRQRRIEIVTSSHPRSVYSLRPARWGDLLALRQLRGETARLDVPEGIITGQRPTYTAMESTIPGLSRAWTYVATVDGEIRAAVQARPRRTNSNSWDVLYLAYGRKDRVGSSEARDQFWAALLDAVTRTAGRRRATRLFARVPDNADAMIALRNAGYIAYGRETLYVAPYHKTARDAEDALPLKRQQSGDTWAIHRLYTLTTPKAMQFAEARTSSYWDLPTRGGKQAAYWIGETHEITAYARTLSGEHTHLIDVLFRPEEGASVVPFVRGVLAALPAGEGDLVYCRALGFQEDLGGMLETLGFSQLTRQSLLVKYTTISVREAVPAFASIPARTRAVARRVPSLSAVLAFSVRWWRRIVRPPWLTHHGDMP